MLSILRHLKRWRWSLSGKTPITDLDRRMACVSLSKKELNHHPLWLTSIRSWIQIFTYPHPTRDASRRGQNKVYFYSIPSWPLRPINLLLIATWDGNDLQMPQYKSCHQSEQELYFCFGGNLLEKRRSWSMQAATRYSNPPTPHPFLPIRASLDLHLSQIPISCSKLRGCHQ